MTDQTSIGHTKGNPHLKTTVGGIRMLLRLLGAPDQFLIFVVKFRTAGINPVIYRESFFLHLPDFCG